jgi:predicted transposase/invertase (TIGR01784 family)
LNTATYQQELKELEFNFVELPKFMQTADEITTTLEKWLFFLKHADELDVIPDSADSVALRAAYHVADQFGWTKEELEVYDYWGIKAQDERGAVQYAWKAGERTGERKGRLEAARKMLAKGYAAAEICDVTGLTAAELAAIASETH